MKNNTTIVVNGKKPTYTKEKIIVTVFLSILIIAMTVYAIILLISNKKFAKEVDDFSKLNLKTVFSIDKIYMYSSSDADSHTEDRAIWNLDIHQFTDMAIYINNRSDNELNYENSIKELYIENVRFSGPELGTPSLHLKNVEAFGKLSRSEDTLISDRLEYSILNDGDLDYSKAQIYADCSNPIVLEYRNMNIKQNEIISDISSDLRFDGELLRKTGVYLNSIKCNLAFDITIINNYNQKFVANVYIDIPLEDSEIGDTIYNGKIVKKLESSNLIRFFRME